MHAKYGVWAMLVTWHNGNGWAMVWTWIAQYIVKSEEPFPLQSYARKRSAGSREGVLKGVETPTYNQARVQEMEETEEAKRTNDLFVDQTSTTHQSRTERQSSEKSS